MSVWTCMTNDPVTATKSEWRDIGGGVSIRELRNAGGELLGIHWRHGTGWCATTDRNFVAVKAYMDDGWDVVSESPLTLSPSLLCRDPNCKVHGHITGGRWVPC